MKLFDLHCDTLTWLYLRNMQSNKEDLMKNKLQVSLKRATGFDAYCQTFAIWTPENITCVEAYKNFYSVLNYFKNELIKYSDYVSLCLSPEDIRVAAEKHKVAAVLSVEGGGVIMGSLEILNDLYKAGVRIFSLTWNMRNSLADGANVKKDCGLTSLGRQVIGEIERLGMILDVSHLSDKSFYDTCEVATKPFIATHSNSRTVCSHQRNLTDEQFKEIVKRQGIVGINLGVNFLENNNKEASASSVVKHIDHFMSFGGENVVAMGADYDGADMSVDLNTVDKAENVAEALLRANYSETLVNKIMYDNIIEFLERNLQAE